MDTIDRVKERLRTSGKTIKEFAEQMGVTPQHVERVLNRRSPLSAKLEQQMLRALEDGGNVITARLPDALYTRLAAWAAANGMEPNEFAVMLLSNMVNVPKPPQV